MKETKITISLRTILLLILTGIGLLLAWELRGLILTLFFAYIINAGLRPLVDWMEGKKISRSVAILISYMLVFGVLLSLGFIVFSSAFTQVRSFLTDIDVKISNFINFVNTNFSFLNQYINFQELSSNSFNLSNLSQNISIDNINQGLLDILNRIGGQGISLLGGIVGGVFSFFVLIMISGYMLKSKDHVYKPLIRLLPDRVEKRIDPVLDKIESSLGSWMVGQLSLMLIIGLITYVILIIPGLFDSSYTLDKYALVIAIIAGLLESVPSIGPLLTLIIALVAAILSGAGLPILVFILISFVALQQLEGVFIVPAVMKRAVDLHPILSIVGAVAGLQLAGPIGALIAIPIVATIQIVVLEVSKEYRKPEKV